MPATAFTPTKAALFLAAWLALTLAGCNQPDDDNLAAPIPESALATYTNCNATVGKFSVD